VVSVPDFIANAGGVICAAVEHRGGTEAQAFAVIEARGRRLLPRAAATELGRARVAEAAGYRRRF